MDKETALKLGIWLPVMASYYFACRYIDKKKTTRSNKFTYKQLTFLGYHMLAAPIMYGWNFWKLWILLILSAAIWLYINPIEKEKK